MLLLFTVISLLHSSRVSTTKGQPVDSSALAYLPPYCSFPHPENNAIMVCERGIPDFASSDRTWLNRVEELTIQSPASCSIEHKTFQHFRNVKSIYMACAGVVAADDLAFVGLNQLANVEIERNAVAFPRHLFCNLKSVTRLSLKNNQLRSDEAFGLGQCSNDGQQQSSYCANNIIYFHASNNRMTSLKKDGFLCNLGFLDVLDLENNAIEGIEKEALARVPRLQILKLAGNAIKELAVDTFQFAAELRTLDLSRNRLTRLPSAVFKPMINLLDLFLRDNLIEVLNEGEFNAVRATTVQLSNNRISWIDHVFHNSNIARLDLSGNRLKTIDYNAVDGLQSLWDLVLSHNAITTIADNVFDQCPYLRKLDLSYNRIKDFSKIGSKRIEDLSTDPNEIR